MDDNPNGSNPIVKIFQNVETRYTKLSKRYFVAAELIVVLYGVILLITPIIDILQNQWEGENEWITLFKTM